MNDQIIQRREEQIRFCESVTAFRVIDQTVADSAVVTDRQGVRSRTARTAPDQERSISLVGQQLFGLFTWNVWQ